MKSSLMALFGEAERGELKQFHYCESIASLFDRFGEPNREAEGLFFAIQALTYGYPILYYRVQEEGVNEKEYLFGLQLLQEYSSFCNHIGALFLPKVGSQSIINEALQLCQKHHGLLIIRSGDFYDYMTAA